MKRIYGVGSGRLGNALLGSESEGLALEEAVWGISAVRVI